MDGLGRPPRSGGAIVLILNSTGGDGPFDPAATFATSLERCSASARRERRWRPRSPTSPTPASANRAASWCSRRRSRPDPAPFAQGRARAALGAQRRRRIVLDPVRDHRFGPGAAISSSTGYSAAPSIRRLPAASPRPATRSRSRSTRAASKVSPTPSTVESSARSVLSATNPILRARRTWRLIWVGNASTPNVLERAAPRAASE